MVLAAPFLLIAPAKSNAQALTVTNNLQLWLKADAGVTTNASGAVTQWADQSGAGNNAAQTDDTAAPLWVADAQNAKPAIHFDGANDYLDVASSTSIAITGDISSFFVVRFDDFASYRSVWGKTAGPNGNLPASTDYYLVPGSGTPRVFRGDGGLENGFVDSSARVRPATYVVLGFEMAGTTMTHYLNGQAAGSGEITAALADAGTALKIGSREDLFTKMKGDIAELLIYDTALSDTNRDSVINYLKLKYNILNLPPTITLTSAPSGTNVNTGDLITLTAAPSDPDGSIARVDFFADGRLIGAAATNPYSVRLSLESPGSVAFTAVATDNKDATAASLPITFLAASASAPSLSATNGLQLWLKADSGVTTNAGGGVTLWSDQSGHGNDGAPFDDAGAPLWVDQALNGRPVLRFDGQDDYLDVASSPSLAISNDIASFFVVRFDDFTTYRAVWSKTVNNVPRPNDYYLVPGSGRPLAYRGSDEDGNVSVAGASGLATNVFYLLGFNQAGSLFTHQLNGMPFGSGFIRIQPADGGSPLKIGTRDDFVTRMQGDIAELLIYNSALDAAQMKNVSAYLGAKYGIPTVVPTNTPASITITNPPNATTVTAPATLSIGAQATDPDGRVVRVDFYIGSGLVASIASPPFAAQVPLPPTSGNFILTAVATDNLSLASTSAPVAITVNSAQPIALPSASHLKLWLRADAGVVTNNAGAVIAWNDQSGGFHNATQSDDTAAPQWVAGAVNAKPALHFDGVNDFLSSPYAPDLAITGDLSTFFVAEIDDFTTYRSVWSQTDGGYPLPTDYYLLPDSGLPRAIRAGYGGPGTVDGVTAPPTNQFMIAGFEMAGATLTHYLNGQENGSGDITNKLADGGVALFVGKRDDSATIMKGHIAEVVIYDSALSGADRDALVTYLANKYAIAIPGAAPSLTVSRSANTVTISWPAAAVGFLLETTDVLPATNWLTVAVDPPPPGQDPSITVPPTPGNKFYRLHKP